MKCEFGSRAWKTSRRWCLVVVLALGGTVAQAQTPSLGDGSQYEVRVVAVTSGKPDLTNVRGSAFLVSPRGLLVTADHVIDDGEQAIKDLFILRPTPPNMTASKVKVVKRFKTNDSKRDVALLQMDRKPEDPDLPYFELASNPEVGEEVFIVGFPLVFDKVYRWPLFRFGRISSTRYFLHDSKVMVLDLISAGGYSGSPVIRRSDGKVLGVQKGGATGNKLAGMSLATMLTIADLSSTDTPPTAEEKK